MSNQMERMRAAVAMLNSGRFSERTKLLAHLTILHPEKKPDELMRLVRAITN
jgi:hypothetical protein